MWSGKLVCSKVIGDSVYAKKRRLRPVPELSAVLPSSSLTLMCKFLDLFTVLATCVRGNFDISTVHMCLFSVPWRVLREATVV